MLVDERQHHDADQRREDHQHRGIGIAEVPIDEKLVDMRGGRPQNRTGESEEKPHAIREGSGFGSLFAALTASRLVAP
jgi:hypothetical protein